MISTSLLLYSEFRLNADALAELDPSIFEGFVKKTLAQPGCVRSEVFRRDDDEEVFVVVNEFADEDALRSHLDADFRVESVAQLSSMLAEAPRRFTMHRVG